MRIIALTAAGKALAERLEKPLAATLCYKPTPFAETVQRWFRASEPLLFICATGIVIRTLAPVLVSKHDDPPVLVMDELGQFVIPLLSGHEGGANELARRVSTLCSATLVLTTANTYLRPYYVVGMGCERHCTFAEIDTLFNATLAQAGLALKDVAALSSIDIKADEIALCKLAKHYGIPFLTWPAEQLCRVEPLLQTPSDYVKKTVGVAGVAESSALFSCAHAHSGATPELLVPKQKSQRATCAIARIYGADASQFSTLMLEPSA
ncbi:cobalt-precorrin 5A hydrolase [Neptunomonas marina]|uniref:Cobalamin biosynthesis protein CbiG n=1 Tax=Neptunomonas marina TaxID=1815562 RepID=A0A437Q456_9GAMM|nr:cobalamin biosynthesis protein [Neptunomonas marina]RVU29307.1 cobalamin biosynthesis protein CbiG [Neptunomonas marina]